MQYTCFKPEPLSEEEKRRLRISVGTKLRLRGTVSRPSRSRIANQLVEFIQDPYDNVKNELLSWLFSYGSPELLGRLIESLARKKTNHRELHALLRGGTGSLLPREYITPYLQKVQIRPDPKTALVCFTGNAYRMNLPVQLFHCLAAGQFDQIFYLRDPEKKFFTQGLRGLSTSLDGLIAEIRRQIPPDSHVAVISTSGGGFAAVRFAEAARASRLAMFSPILKTKDDVAVSGPAKISPADTRIFFAIDYERDVAFASDWAGTGYATSIRWFDSDSHGTLRYLFNHGQVQPLIDWLRGGKDVIPYGKLGKPLHKRLGKALLSRFNFRN